MLRLRMMEAVPELNAERERRPAWELAQAGVIAAASLAALLLALPYGVFPFEGRSLPGAAAAFLIVSLFMAVVSVPFAVAGGEIQPRSYRSWAARTAGEIAALAACWTLLLVLGRLAGFWAALGAFAVIQAVQWWKPARRPGSLLILLGLPAQGVMPRFAPLWNLAGFWLAGMLPGSEVSRVPGLITLVLAQSVWTFLGLLVEKVPHFLKDRARDVE